MEIIILYISRLNLMYYSILVYEENVYTTISVYKFQSIWCSTI